MKRVLFVRSGGGLVGLDVHMGIWKALSEAGIEATTVIGNSAGAVVSALDATGRGALDAEQVIRRLSDEDAIRYLTLWPLRIFTSDNLLTAEPIKVLLGKLLPQSFSELKTELRTVAVDAETGEVVVFSKDSAPSVPVPKAVQASMSISGLFPWCEINGREYADAGPRANLPLPKDWMTYDELWLLVTSPTVTYHKDASGVINRLRLNFDWYGLDQIFDVIDIVRGSTAPVVHVIWPDIERKANFIHFNHDMINDAYEYTKRYLQGSAGPAKVRSQSLAHRGGHSVLV